MSYLGRFWGAMLFLSVQVMVCFAAEPSRPFQLAPIAFEANRGQAPQKYSFLFHRDGLRAMFFANGTDLTLCGKSGCDEKLTLTFVGANSIPESTSGLTGHANYFFGNDSARWIRSIPLSSVIEYKELYPGISLRFYGNGQELEHDFHIAPGADPSRIALQFDGPARIALTSDGDLEIHTKNGGVTLKSPVAYQQTSTGRIPVDAGFLQAEDGSIGFRVGAYDRTRPLVIDPVIVFSSYLGGTGRDLTTAITTDPSGDVLVTGSTTSTDFPTKNPLQSSLGTNGQSVFVTKFDPTGKTLIYSTYLGGSSQALGAASATGGAIAVDANDNAIVAGLTSSANFPTAGAGTSLSCQNNYDCFFLASLSSDGSRLNYSGTVGGEQGSYIYGSGVNLAVDATGNAYLAGTTHNSNFQITTGTLAPSVTGYPYDETFVLKVDPTGRLIYSTVIPGTDTNSTDLLQPYTNDFIPTGIAVNSQGDVTIAGTSGLGLPTTSGVVGPQFPNAYVNVENPSAGFVLQLNPTASAINFASYLPGTDYGFGLAVDTTGNFYVTGGTQENNLPVSANAYQKAPGTLSDGQTAGAYVIVLNPQATAVVEATYLGADAVGGYGFRAIALDGHNNIFVGGYAESQDLPLQNPFVTEYEYTGSTADMVLAEMSPDLSTLKFGSFFSATSGVFAGSNFAGMAIDNSNNLVVTGTTSSLDFPTTAGSFEPHLPTPANPNVGFQHSFVAKFDMTTPAPAICFSTFIVAFGNVNANSSVNQSLNVTNCGNAPLAISSAVSSDPTVVVSESCGTIAAGASCLVNLTFTPVSSQGTTGAVTFTDNAQTLPQSVSFSGQGIAPQISAYPNPVSFGHYVVGTAAVSATLEIQNGGQANLQISNVSITGAGFSVAENECTQPMAPHSLCFVVLSFVPASTGVQMGSLIISSNDPVNPQFTIPLTGIGDSTYGVPNITSIGAGTVQINSGPQTVQITGDNFYPQSVVQVAGVTQATTFVSNSALTATIAPSSLTAIGELPLVVANPTPGGGASPAAALTPYRTLLIAPAAVVSVPATGKIYAAIPSSATSNPNTVIPIDPTTGTLGTAISVGNNPGLLAASSDGSFLYVANQGDFTVQRINLATNTVERTFPYTPNIYCSTCTNVAATDLATVPGSPQEVLLSQGSWLTLYNDAGSVNYVPNDGVCCTADPDFGSIALAGNPLTIYGLPFTYAGGYFQVADLTSSGLQYTRPTAGSYSSDTPGAQLISDGTLLYTSAGQVWNPATQTQIGTFPVTSINITSYPNMRALSLDTSLGEIYWIGYQNYASLNNSTAAVISVYGTKSYALTGTLAFPQIDYPFLGDLVRWGSDGLAFIGSGAGLTDQELYVLRSSVVSPKINSAATNTALSISPAGGTLMADSAYTLSATVTTGSGAPVTTGNVIFTIGSATQTVALDASGIATYSGIAPGSAGSLAFSAQYQGSTGFSPSNSPTLNEAIINIGTSTTLTASSTQVLSGAQATLTATVTATSGTATPSGSVNFYDGSSLLQSASLTNGVARIATTSLPVGADVVSATYLGGSLFSSSTSNSITINVTVPNPAPVLNSLSPAFTSAGAAAFTLTVNGSGFVSGSTVYWGSTALSTQFGSASQLTAQVQSAQIAQAGVIAVTVETPVPGGGTSNTMQFEVDAAGGGSGPSFGTTSVSIAPGATASYPVTLPASATNVSVKCLNLPSGATCSYSSTTGTLTVATSSSTPPGTYVITAVFTETLPGAATALLLFPFLFSLCAKRGRKSKSSRIWILACAGILVLVALAGNGCGGGKAGGGGTTSTTHQVTSSGSVTLTVQ